MKIRAVLKDPDSLHAAVEDAITADLDASTSGISDQARASMRTARVDDVWGELSERWVAYSEYLIVEFDTDDWTATVRPASEFK